MSDEEIQYARISAGDLSEPLLEHLRVTLNTPHLTYRQKPVELGAGLANEVFQMSVVDGRDGLGRHAIPLACRVPKIELHDEIETEFAVHYALNELGVKTPTIVDRGSLAGGVPFVAMERIPGLSGQQCLGFAVLAAIVVVVPGLLGYVPLFGAAVLFLLGLGTVTGVWFVAARRLHGLEVSEFEQQIANEGARSEDVHFKRRLSELRKRVDALPESGQVLQAFEWLAKKPQETEHVVCHGDFHFGNMMIHWLQGTALIDLGRVTIAPREFDLAWLQNLPAFVKGPPFRESPLAATYFLVIGSLAWLMTRSQVLIYRLFMPYQQDVAQYFRAFHALDVLVLLDDPNLDFESSALKTAVVDIFRNETGISLDR